jgi:hypothetical protein
LEERRVLNAQAMPVEQLVIDAGDAGGDGQADTFHVEQDAEHVRVSVNGQEVSRTPLGQIDSITIRGSLDDDILVAEFKSGEPLAGLELLFDGGQGGADTLVLTEDMAAGGGALSEVSHHFGEAGQNQIELATDAGSSTIDYVGVETVDDQLAAQNRTFTFDIGNRQIALDDNDALDDDVSRIVASDADDPSSVLTVTFKNPSERLGIESIASSGESNTVELNGLDQEFDADLRVSGSNNDVLTVGGSIDVGRGDVELLVGSVTIEDSLTTAGGSIQVEAEREVTIGNTGVLRSDLGDVSVTSTSIEHNGSIYVASGQVTLDSGAQGTTIVRGVVDVSAADTLLSAGTVHILGHHVGLLDDAHITATAAIGGGVILIGGDYQGKNPAVHNAARTYVGPNAVIRADATQRGTGGKVVVWADEITSLYGTISARGGSEAGDGGFIETSGKVYLDFQGNVDASAPHGNGGTWFLDPEDIVIDAVPNANVTLTDVTAVDPGPRTFPITAVNVVTTIDVADINAALDLGFDVIISTAIVGGPDAGTITVDAPIVKTLDGGNADGSTLTFLADSAITVNSAITSAVGELNIIFTAGAGIDINAAITTNGGSLQSSGTTFDNTGGTITTAGGDVTLTHTGLVTIGAPITTLAGNIDITGDAVAQNANLSTTGAGTIDVTATTGSITMANAAITTSVTGAITYSAEVNVAVSQITSASGAIDVEADTGAISDSTAADATSNLTTTGTVTLDAETGIGAAAAADIDTTIDTLTATNSAAGDIVIEETNTIDLVSVDADNGSVTVTATAGDIDVGLVEASANVTLTAVAGSITDGNLGTNNITAVNLTLTANAAGQTIGTLGDPLDVTLGGTLTASATAGAGIFISETGALSIVTVSAGAGQVRLTSTTTINESVNDATDKIITTGAVTLVAPDGIGNLSPLDLGGVANLTLDTNGSFNVATDVALTDLTMTVDPAGGPHTYTLTDNGNLTFTVTDGGADLDVTTVSVAAGNLNYNLTTDSGNINLAVIAVGAGAVSIVATTGSILDDNLGVNNITAGNLSLTANGAGQSIGAVGDLLDVTLSGALTASATTGTGGIHISETGNMVVALVNAGAGNVVLDVINGSLNSQTVDGTADIVGAVIDLSVTGAGNDIGTSAAAPLELNATTLSASTAGAAGDAIFIRDTAGGVAAGLITAGAGNVSLAVLNGSLTSQTVDGTADIVGATINLTVSGAGNDIGTSAAAPLEINATTVLNAATAGAAGDNIFIRDTAGGLVVGLVNAGAGNVSLEVLNGSLTSQTVDGTADIVGASVSVSVTGAGNDIGTSAAAPLEVNAVTLSASTAGAAGDDIFIRDTVGGVAAGLITAGAGNVSLAVLNGSLTSQTVDGTADVVGATVTLSVAGAGSDIGMSTAAPLEINASTVLNAVTAGAAGDNIFIRDTAGGLVVGLVNAGAGNVDLEAIGGSLTSQTFDGTPDIVGAVIDVSVTGAGNDIGTSAAAPLELNATTLSASTAGTVGSDIFIRDTAGGVAAALITAGAGNVDLEVLNGSLTSQAVNGAADIVGATIDLVVTGAGSDIGTSAAAPLEINATTVLNATTDGAAGDDIFIRDTTGGLAVGLVTAGAGNVDLEVLSGSLTSLTVDGTADVVGAAIDVSVTGSGNDIGTSTAAPVELNATVLSASTAGTAGSDIFIRDMAGGVAVGLITAGAGNVNLDVLNGSLTSQAVDGTADIVGATMNLSVSGAGNDIGTSAAAPLEVNAAVLSASTGGAVGDDIFIRDTAAGVAAGLISAGVGNVDLAVLNGSLTSQTVDGTADIVGAIVDLTVTGAGSDMGTSAAAPLEINATTVLNAATDGAAGENIFIRDTATGLVAGLVTAGAGNVGLEVINGSLTSQNVDNVADVVGATIDLTVTGVGSDIGASALAPLEIDSTSLLNAATNGAAGDEIFIDDVAGNLTLGLVISGLGNTQLRALAGSILDANGNTNNITAGNLVLTANAAGQAIGAAGDLLDVTLSGTLTASANNGAGGIFISETGDMSLASVTADSGAVQLVSTLSINESVNNAVDKIVTTGAVTLIGPAGIGNLSTLDLGGVTDLTLDTNGSFNLSTSGVLTALVMTVDPAGGPNTYTLVDNDTAAANLTFNVTDGGADLNVTNVSVAAGNLAYTLTTDSGSINVGTVAVGAGNTNVTATAGSIVDANGNTNNITAGNLVLTANAAGQAIGAAGDLLDVTLSGTLTASANNGAGGIFISETGDMLLESADAATGNVSLNSTGAIVDAADDPAADVVGTNLLITGALGIAFDANFLETDVSLMEAKGGTGGLFVQNQGALTIGNVDAATTGASAAQSVSVATLTGNLTVAEQVTSTSQSVSLNASVDLEIDAPVVANQNVNGVAGTNLATTQAVTATSGIVFFDAGNDATLNGVVSAGQDLTIDAGNVINFGANLTATNGDMVLKAGLDKLSALNFTADIVLEASGGKVSSATFAFTGDRYTALDKSKNVTPGPLTPAQNKATIQAFIEDLDLLPGTKYELTIDWKESGVKVKLEDPRFDTFFPLDGNLAKQFAHRFVENPDQNNPTADIPITVNITSLAGGTIRPFIGGTRPIVDALDQTVDKNGDFTSNAGAFLNNAVGIRTTINIPVLTPLTFVSQIPALPSLPQVVPPPPVLQTAFEVTSQPVQRGATLPVESSAAITSEGEERYYELRIVFFDENGQLRESPLGERINLNDDRLQAIAPFDLSKLPELFGRLPADRYRIYLIEDGTERLVLDFIIQQGQPVEVPEAEEGAPVVAPAAEEAIDNLPAELQNGVGQPDVGVPDGPVNGTLPPLDNGTSRDEMLRRAVSINLAPGERIVSESFAERLGRSPFFAHGGVVAGAATLACATSARRERAVDRLMERFDWRRQSKRRDQKIDFNQHVN